MYRLALPLLALVVASTSAPAQDKVTFRDRAAKGVVQTVTGQITAESLAGVRVGGRMIPAGDILEVAYDVPGEVRILYRSATAETKPPAEASAEYESLLKNPRIQSARPVKQHLESRLAALAAARADEGPPQRRGATDAIRRFNREHPDAWQRVPLTRTLARLLLDAEPPDVDGARKAYEELAAAPGAPPDLKTECTLQVIDLLIEAKRPADAQAKLSALPASDPRARLMQIGAAATPATLDAAVKQLETYIDQTADPALKAAAYIVLGDTLRRDPKRLKDALYAYLKVDVVFNQDPVETQRAVARLAKVFEELKDEPRAKAYRDRLRGK